jgi:hypothetical protein
MISVSQYNLICKDGIWIVTGTEAIPCPICGGDLYVRGTCRRFLRRPDESKDMYRLRVLCCKTCGRSHRELIDEIVPYKRHSVDAICTMQEKPDECLPEPSVRLRVIAWLCWFLRYAAQIKESLRLTGVNMTEPPGDLLRRRLMHYVRLVVNSGNWVQHRLVMICC